MAPSHSIGKFKMTHRLHVLATCLFLAGGFVLLVGCAPRAAAVTTAEPKDAPPADDLRFEVEATRNLTYYEGDDPDKEKHKLDLYLPKGKKDFPVVVFVHGGAWVFGDRNFFGVY